MPSDAPIFTARTRNCRGKPKAACTTPGEHYYSKANHGAVIYTWPGDDKATVHNFQSEFRGLHPQIALVRIRSRLQLDRRPLGAWAGVDTGYVVELHAGDLIFLKANHIADTFEFYKPLRPRTLYPIYFTHLLHNFPGGRGSYVHEKLNEMA